MGGSGHLMEFNSALLHVRLWPTQPVNTLLLTFNGLGTVFA